MSDTIAPNTTAPKTAECLFISHGGGPLPLLGDPSHADLVKNLKAIAGTIKTPSAILIISAHWEQETPTITSGSDPELIYDYFGFPPESYAIKYPCAGEPQLAKKVYHALTRAGIKANMDNQRGFDHGMFVPLKLMFPAANIPCVQLSLVNTLDAQTHIAIGEALQAINYDNLLIIGSGFSFHNLREFFGENSPENNAKNIAFENWLAHTLTDATITEPVRRNQMIQWQKAPYARYCHPREEHLLPLHVCYGFAARPSDRHIATVILNKQSGMFYWQGK